MQRRGWVARAGAGSGWRVVWLDGRRCGAVRGLGGGQESRLGKGVGSQAQVQSISSCTLIREQAATTGASSSSGLSPQQAFIQRQEVRLETLQTPQPRRSGDPWTEREEPREEPMDESWSNWKPLARYQGWSDAERQEWRQGGWKEAQQHQPQRFIPTKYNAPPAQQGAGHRPQPVSGSQPQVLQAAPTQATEIIPVTTPSHP